MTRQDRARWDQRYATREFVDAALPATFSAFVEEFPVEGVALELACGRGSTAVWLAQRGLTVTGYDVSPVALRHADELAARYGVAARCRFETVDLDDGLPAGPPANVIVCHRFRDPRLDDAVTARLAPGGLLAISALSEVGAAPGPFRVRAGELARAFGALEVISAGEADGLAWLLARHRILSA